MKLTDFDYSYPKELIAQRPLEKRDDSRMMIVKRSDKSFAHSFIKELPTLLKKDDILVINDTKVIPSRLFGRRSGGEDVELLVVEPSPEKTNLWKCLLKKAKRVRLGEKFFFGMQATATAKGRDGIYLLVEFKGNSLDLAMKHHGVLPLPPYIERSGYDSYSEEDKKRYQTVYAEKTGSAAAPTAGLHLSEEIIKMIELREIDVEKITLHVGIDTFTPVRAEKIADHKMHGERVEINEQTARKINLARKSGKRIVAVGTTTTRALESAANDDGGIRSGEWTTDIFITPGYKFRIVDAMLTNFHLPKSTLLMMVSAFAGQAPDVSEQDFMAGRKFILSCYEEAIRERYRFFSYGDCMFIE